MCFIFFFQEDMTGIPITMGIDRELVKDISCDIEWERKLKQCLLKKLEDMWTNQKTEACADCVVKQLNLCH